MKKLLALVLALVMTLGLATVGSNAALSDLKDADKIKGGDFEEAITVVEAVGVMVGDNNNNFEPTKALTRAEGAMIAARLIATNKVAASLTGNGKKFSDVPANFWNGNGSGVIEYCAANGILNGVGNGKFDPNGALSTVAFAKMMLTSLGYDSNVEGYVNNVDWQTNVMTRAQRLGLLNGLDGVMANDQLTREQAAQMVFNTLKTPIVEYDAKIAVSVNGADVSVGNTNAKPVTNEEMAKQTIYANRVNAQQNANGAYVVEFAEQYYPKLVLKTSEDPFGRPAVVWTYGRDELGLWTNQEYFVKNWTTAVTGDTVYNTMGALAYKNYPKEVWVDGVQLTGDALKTIVDKIARDGGSISETGLGILTELYVYDGPTDATSYARLVIVNTYLAEVYADYNTSAKTLTIGTYMASNAATRMVASADDVEEDMSSYKEGDYVLVTVTKPADADNRVVRSVVAPELTAAAYVSGYTVASNKVSSLDLESGNVKVAKRAYYDATILEDYTKRELKGFKYDVYTLPELGYVIGIEEAENASNFLFLTGFDLTSAVLSSATHKANAIFTDGTMSTIDVALSKTLREDANNPLNAKKANVNGWFVFTKEEGSTVYTLQSYVPFNSTAATGYAQAAAKSVDNQATGADISAVNPQFKYISAGTKYALADDKTVFITVSTTDAITGPVNGEKGAIASADAVTTGIKNTSIVVANTAKGMTSFSTKLDPQMKALGQNAAGETQYDTFFLFNTKGRVVAAVVVGEDSAATNNLVYVISGPTHRGYDAKYIDTYTVIKNGAIEKEFKVNSDKTGTTNTKLAATGLYKVGYDKDGVVVTIDGPLTKHTMNTAVNAQYGYVVRALTAAESITLTNGNSLNIKNNTLQDEYVLIGDKAVFFVQAANGSYVQYANASQALNACDPKVDPNVVRITKLTAACDKGTGFANTVIFNVTYKTTTAASSDVELKGTILPGIYGGVKFYAADNHAITWAEAKEALEAQMKADGCTDIIWSDADTVSFKYNNIQVNNQTIAAMAGTGGTAFKDLTLTGANKGQVYQLKVTTLKADGTVDNTTTAYVPAGADTGAQVTALNAVASGKGTGLAAANVVIRTTSDGVLDEGVAFAGVYGANALYDGTADGDMPASNIVVVRAANTAAALNYLIKTEATPVLTSSINVTGNVVVPAGKTLTLGENVALNVTGNLTVDGTLNDESTTATTVNATGDVIVDQGEIELVAPGSKILAGGAIKAWDGAQVTCDIAHAPIVYLGCSMTVKTLEVDTIYLRGYEDASVLTVETTLTNAGSGDVDVIVGGWKLDDNYAYAAQTTAVSGSSEIILPENSYTAIDDVAVNGALAVVGNGTIDGIDLVGGSDDVITLVPETDNGMKINEVTSTSTGTIEATKSITLENANGAEITVPSGTTDANGNTIKGSENVESGKNLVKLGVGPVSGKPGSTYFVAGDTITVTFNSTVKTADGTATTAKATGTPVSANPEFASVSLKSGTTLTLTVSSTIDTDSEVVVTGLKADITGYTDLNEAVDSTLTVTIGANGKVSASVK